MQVGNTCVIPVQYLPLSLFNYSMYVQYIHADTNKGMCQMLCICITKCNYIITG